MSEPEAEKPKSDLRKLMNRDVSRFVRFIFFGVILLIVFLVLGRILLDVLVTRDPRPKSQQDLPVSGQRR
jgi:hypothetical protein